MCNKCNQNHSHHSHHNCGCTEVEEVTYICNECQPEPCTECAVKDLGTKCIVYDGDDLECSGIKKNTILTELIQQLDAFICEVKEELKKYFTLVNIGSGKKIYAGDNLLGNKKLRTISKTGDLITVTEATEEIVIGLDEDELENTITSLLPNYNAENVGTGADVFKEEVSNTFRFRTIKSSDSSVEITEGVNEIDLKVIPSSEILCIEADNNSMDVFFDENSNCYKLSANINPVVELQNGTTTNVNGDGVSTPYSVEVKNLQKVISTDYTLQASDDKHTIFIDNGATPLVTITVTNSIPNNFACVFIQKGTGDVQFSPLDINQNIKIPAGLTDMCKGQNHWVLLERELTTNNYYLGGSLKIAP
jgi:hypothetical protein